VNTTAAGAATCASAGAASATTFFGRPRGFFAGAASVDAVGVGAVTTAAGASPVSLYGFGSSPDADLRGERGPRPGAGRRRSVMSSMCYVVTGHGAVRNHRRARRTHAAWRLFGTLTTSRTTPSGSMHGCKTVANKKIWSGHRPKHCSTALEKLRRYACQTIVDIRHQPRRIRHTAIGERHSGGRAIGHTDLGCARSGEGTGVDSQGFQHSNA